MTATRSQDAANLSLLQEREKARPRPRQAVLAGALAMFALLTAIYIASIDISATRGTSITGDEPFYLLTTQSLLQDHDLDLRQQYEQRSYEFFFGHPDGLWRQSVPREDGTVLSPHNPGLSVLLLPGFAAAGLVGAQTQMLVMAALTFALTYVLVVRLTGEPLWSWVATIAVALSATSFIYSTEIYPEVPAALALVASLIILQGTQRPGIWRALALAGCLTAMTWLGIKYAPLAALVALWFLWRANSHARLTLLAVGGLSAALFAWFHLQTFGGLTPYTVGAVYAGDSTGSIIRQHLAFWERGYRLWGLFIDARFGIGRWAPVLLPAVPALLLLWKHSVPARLVLALVVIQLFTATFVAITMMGWWFPGRTLMTVLPLLALPLTLLLVRLPVWGRVGVGLLGTYSLAITAALASAGQTREIVIAVNPFDMPSPIFQITAVLFPNYTFWDAGTWGLTAAWLVLGGAAMLVMYLVSSTSVSKPYSYL
jgi:hypothetical protein